MENLLNNVQKQIVETTEGSVMVLAGAGSGKTRVLTHKIAYILNKYLARPYEILAITFTNKAANEIKNRLFSMGIDAFNVWAMTFHSMCAKILRIEANYLDGYNSNFSIFDEQDKKNVIKKLLKEKNIKEDEMLGQIADSISKYKMSNLSLDEYGEICCFSQHDKLIFDFIKLYEEKMRQENAMDFDDLILKTLLLLKTNDFVKEKYQRQFRYILVDEFQDTNESQYELVKILAGYHKNIFAVGDEDQSIYSWRGASVDNIKRFLKDFENTKLIKLEQNYRSTKNILDYANKIIKNNKNRIDKTLWTDNIEGERVVYNKSFEDRDEADFVTKKIYSLVHEQGYKYKDIAVLMRMNALTRNFEDKFVAYNIPYKVFGGLKFYERAEIKSVMAYFKLLINPYDEESFFRIINFPKRGIGDGAIQKLKEYSMTTNLFDAVMNLDDNIGGTLAKFLPFKNLMKDFLEVMQTLGLFDFCKYVVDRTNILSEYSDNTEENINRKLNISELLQNIKNYQDDNPSKTLVDFLQVVSLATDIDNFDEQENSVSLATVHSVKGLEFNVVFVIGLEEKFFPIIRDDSTQEDMEEERRLMYVAITRAKERLYLTSSASRYMYGKINYLTPSRFLTELGFETKSQKTNMFDSEYQNNSFGDNYGQYGKKETNYHYNNFGGSLNSFMHQTMTKKAIDFSVGDRVFHSNYGVGFVTFVDSNSRTAKIDFERFGNKVLSLDFAPIKKL